MGEKKNICLKSIITRDREKKQNPKKLYETSKKQIKKRQNKNKFFWWFQQTKKLVKQKAKKILLQNKWKKKKKMFNTFKIGCWCCGSSVTGFAAWKQNLYFSNSTQTTERFYFFK